MPERIFVQPKSPELKIKDPSNGRFLPVEGAEVNLTSFWVRRMNAGDVVEVRRAPPKPESKPETPKSVTIEEKTPVTTAMRIRAEKEK